MPADYIIRPIATDHVTRSPSYLPIADTRVTDILHKGYDPKFADTEGWCLATYLRSLRKNIHCGMLEMQWSRKSKGKVTKRSECDRAVAKGCLSAGDTLCEVRDGLWGDTVYDFDQCCSHQTLMLCALQADSDVDVPTEFPNLLNYTEHKEEERKRVADAYFQGDIKKAKQMYQAVTFGGKPLDPYGEPLSDPALIGYYREMGDFKARICEANPSFHKEMKKCTKAKGKEDWQASLMSLWCRNKESEVIEAVVGDAIKIGLIQDSRFDNSKDGIMIPIADVDAYLANNNDAEHETLADICAHFEEVGADVTGYRVQWDRKPMMDAHVAFWNKMDALNVELPAQPADGSGLKFDWAYVRSLPTTESKLGYFNIHFAYILSQAAIVHIQAIDVNHPDGTTERKRDLTWYSAKDLQTAFGNIDSGQKNSLGNPIPLPTVWLSADCRRTYVKVGAFPYPDVYNPSRAEYHSKDVCNTFVGYPEIVWKNARQDEYTPEDMLRIIDPFVQMVSHLIGCQCYDKDTGRFPHLYEYPTPDRNKIELLLKVVGIRIAHPDQERQPYAILIRGMQGTGKNTFTEVLAALVGLTHYKCSSNIDDFLGTHAEGLENKLIAVLNEIDLSQSLKNEGKVKGLVSEDTATANPKNIRPYEFTVAALFIALSNNACPLRIDVNNGDRRWLVFESNDWCPVHWTRDIWAALRARFKDTVFLRALRQYFCKQDYTSYDFKLAKVANVKSTAYQKLVQYFVPAEARFVQNFIETQMYNPGPLFADAVVDTDGPAFYTNTKWDTPVQVNARKFFEDSKGFYKEYCINGGVAEKSLQSFNNKLQTISQMVKKTDKRGQVSWEFTPREVYGVFVDKGYISQECIDYGLKQALVGKEEESADELTLAQLGFVW